MEANKFKMMVRRIKKTSPDGFERLSRKLRRNYIKEVYKPLKRVIINTDRVYDERTLAYFLILKFGVGQYDALGYSPKNRKFNYQLFRVVILGNPDSKWGYEFKHTNGIGRYGFWISE